MFVQALQIANRKLQNEDFGDSARVSGDDRSLPPAACPRPRRLGITLTEVLISMGILTLGLLGVASLFPVGGYYMLKAEISDRGSAIAQSVMNDLISRGMLNTWAWYVMTPSSGVAAPLNGRNQNWVFNNPRIDGKYCPTPTATTFTRPFAEALAAGLSATSDPELISRQFGNAFVIDPSFAAAATRNVSSIHNRVAYAFPATAYTVYPGTGSGYYSNRAWSPWRATSNAPLPAAQMSWPIRRVTFQQSNGWPLNTAMADKLCRGEDDLVTDLPERDDRPASQNWDIAVDAGTQFALARQSAGDYSWIATIVPTTYPALSGMARNPESFEYDVSVVVFYKRVLPSTPPALDPSAFPDALSNERMVSASIVSTGLNGGELLLTDIGIGGNIQGAASPFEQLKAGQWIMLCGPHPNSTPSQPQFVLNWYQVLSIDTTMYGNDYFDATKQRVVTVRGPQWPWQPAGPPFNSYGDLSNDLCVGIFRGAVAVHAKTLRLQSKTDGGMTLVVPPRVAPPTISF